jgi:hypothetical protein
LSSRPPAGSSEAEYELIYQQVIESISVPNKALQPTRAAQPNEQREPAENGPRS